MIDRDITFRYRTYLVFFSLGCVVKFQAREANSLPRSASNRVCVPFLFLSVFSFSLPSYYFQHFFSFTFINYVGKADSASLQLLKKIHINDWLVLDQTHTLTQTTVEETRKGRKETEQFAASLDLWIWY